MSSSSSLQALAARPFELLLELERRARAAIAAREGAPAAADEWVGIGFRLAAERFVTSREDAGDSMGVGTAEPHDADPATPRRRRDGRDGVGRRELQSAHFLAEIWTVLAKASPMLSVVAPGTSATAMCTMRRS